jgi:hypothetical protein
MEMGKFYLKGMLYQKTEWSISTRKDAKIFSKYNLKLDIREIKR